MVTRLTVNTYADDDAVWLRVVGEIDLSNVEQFAAALDELVADAQNVVCLDLSRVDYLDSSAINALFEHAHRIQITANPVLVGVLAVSGLTDLIPVTATDGSPDTP